MLALLALLGCGNVDQGLAAEPKRDAGPPSGGKTSLIGRLHIGDLTLNAVVKRG
jgi:hypothetical protein